MKKILITLLLCLPFGMMAQQKIAIVNAQAVLVEMAEYKAAQATLEELGKKYDNDLKSMQEDLIKKSDAYTKEKDTLSEVMRKTRESELQDIYARIGQSEQAMREDMMKQEQALLTPIHQKLLDMIKKVGDEKGYTYILDASAAFYMTGPGAMDVTNDLRDKLGIKSGAAAVAAIQGSK